MVSRTKSHLGLVRARSCALVYAGACLLTAVIRSGVLYKLGVAGGLKTWENPARNGLCRVICGLQGVTATNGVREVAAHKEDVLERAVVADTFAFDDGWFILDLDPADLGVTLRPSYYTIRNGGGKVGDVSVFTNV